MLRKDSIHASQKILYTFGRKTNRRICIVQQLLATDMNVHKYTVSTKSKDLSMKLVEICSYH